MLLREFGVRERGGVRAAEADVLWEEADRPSMRIFVESRGAGAEALRADPSAFLAATVLPAWRAGERRVRVEGPVCPLLLRRLGNVLTTLRSWNPDLGRPPAIEAAGPRRGHTPTRGGAVSLLSCGIDSLFTLRWNKLHVPRGHPLAIEGCVVVWYGRDPAPLGGGFEDAPARLVAAGEIAADAGVAPLPARTNLWWLDGDGHFFDQQWHGAVLAAVAACFSGRYSAGLIASSFEGNRLTPWGSHPLLDPNYGSLHFRIQHDGTERTRFQKTRLVAEWPAALENLRVCQNDHGGAGNCGTCEKCIRTMTALVALGRLPGSAFPVEDVDAGLIASIERHGMIVHGWQRDWYEELRGPLSGAGRRDLVEAIDEFVLRTDPGEEEGG